MSYRKKHHPAKPQKPVEQVPQTVEFKNPGTLRSLPLSILNSGLPYQRAVRPKRIRELKEKWDTRYLEPLVVSFRDGRFNVVDGQHRIAILREKSGGADCLVDCMVYDGMSYEDEADFCYELDKSKQPMSLSQSTNARVESARDPTTSTIRELMEQYGFTWALGKARPKEHEVTATQAVINAYRLLGSDLFGRMLWLLDSVWHGDLFSVSAAMISGMALFLKTYETELDDYIGCRDYSRIVSREIFDRAGEKRRRNTRSCKLTEGQKALQRLSGRRLNKSEEQQVRNLMLRLILHPELVQPVQRESADRTEAIRIRNELERLLCEQPLQEAEATAQAFHLAAAQYALLGDSEYETERIRDLLFHASTDQALDPILLKETVASVRSGGSGEIEIELKNHQIIA